MGAQILGLTGGVLTVKVSGKLEPREWTEAQRSAAELIRTHGPVRILILTDGFLGWVKSEEWGNLSFQIENDRWIEKMAVVADEFWKDLALMFTGQGLRPFPVEHFRTEQEDQARAWLAAKG